MWTRRRELAAYLRSQQLLLARHRRGWDWDRVQFTVKMKTPVKTRTMPSEDSHTGHFPKPSAHPYKCVPLEFVGASDC